MREEADLTLREVSYKMGVALPYLSDLEHGRRPWSHDLETRFRRALK